MDFDDLANKLVEVSAYISPSEIHGLMTGLLCGGGQLSARETEYVVCSHFEQESMPAGLAGQLEGLNEDILASLDSGSEMFDLMLPDEDTGLQECTEALGLWCQGFLVGFGTTSKQANDNSFSSEVQSALKDVVEIANLEPADSDDEELQRAYTEIVEYLRVAAMVIFVELSAGSGKEPGPQANNKVLH